MKVWRTLYEAPVPRTGQPTEKVNWREHRMVYPRRKRWVYVAKHPGLDYGCQGRTAEAAVRTARSQYAKDRSGTNFDAGRYEFTDLWGNPYCGRHDIRLVLSNDGTLWMCPKCDVTRPYRPEDDDREEPPW